LALAKNAEHNGLRLKIYQAWAGQSIKIKANAIESIEIRALKSGIARKVEALAMRTGVGL
jgi:hypothetical protein